MNFVLDGCITKQVWFKTLTDTKGLAVQASPAWSQVLKWWRISTLWGIALNLKDFAQGIHPKKAAQTWRRYS
ncbi:hypothetical protein AQ436_08895 [Arthrobacter sp. EpRS66]|nr:hypothetical protein AQ436_08895 [Arthrobacter sp. EpRS66]